MGGDTFLLDPECYDLLRNIAYTMESRGVSSLPLKTVQTWPSALTLDRLMRSGLVRIQKDSIELDIQKYQEMIWNKVTGKLKITFPTDIDNCLGSPWTPEKRLLVNCRPRLEDVIYAITANMKTRDLICNYLRRTASGVGINIKPRPLENVIVLPSFHEGDYLQYPKIKRAIKHYKPDFVAVEGLGPIGTRYLVLSCFTLRGFSGFPYCLVIKPYVYNVDRIEFFSKYYKDADGIKACLTAESDFNAVLASCIGQSTPFFPIGVPEECVKLYFSDYFRIEKQAWEICCKDLEDKAKQRMMWDLDSLCDHSKVKEIEEIVIEGRAIAPLEYKRQLMWSENYMISRLVDFLAYVGFDTRIVAFVGLCHALAMETKLKNGSWQYIPPIDERVVPISIGLAPSKIAAYIQLYDPTDANFVNRFEKAFSPSPMFAEFFGMKESDFIQSVERNMKNVIYTNSNEETAQNELLDLLVKFRTANPSVYTKLMRAVENHVKTNGLDGNNWNGAV